MEKLFVCCYEQTNPGSRGRRERPCAHVKEHTHPYCNGQCSVGEELYKVTYTLYTRCTKMCVHAYAFSRVHQAPKGGLSVLDANHTGSNDALPHLCSTNAHTWTHTDTHTHAENIQVKHWYQKKKIKSRQTLSEQETPMSWQEKCCGHSVNSDEHLIIWQWLRFHIPVFSTFWSIASE